jgi:hypothetical protein
MTYKLQYLNGSTWCNCITGGSEQSLLVQGESYSSREPSKRFRLVCESSGRTSVIHIF